MDGRWLFLKLAILLLVVLALISSVSDLISSKYRYRSDRIRSSSGIIIPADDFYRVPFSIVSTNLLTKSLKIQYTCSTPGERKVKLVKLHRNVEEAHVTAYDHREQFLQGTNDITIPFSRFVGANMTLDYGFEIGGPLTVHNVDLVDAEVVSGPSAIVPPQTAEESFPQTEVGAALPVPNVDLINAQEFPTIARIPLAILSDYAEDAPSSMSYREKLAAFKRRLSLLRISFEKLKLTVSRTNVWEDVYHIIDMDSYQLRRKLEIKYAHEIGDDMGGLTREFFSLFANIINNPSYGLFKSTEDSGYALQINPSSTVQGYFHLRNFKLIGRIIGMALLSENVMGVRLIPSLYRKLRTPKSTVPRELPELIENDESEVDISELKAVDKVLYEQLDKYLNMKVGDAYGMTMEMEWDDLGLKIPVSLIKNGDMIDVTEANKKQYVREYAKWRIEYLVEEQANALRDGVWDVVPQTYLSRFTESELEILIGGQPRIDLNDWKHNTVYETGYTSSHPTVEMFWQCLESWDNAQRSKLLQFVTGSPRVPSTGFTSLFPHFTMYFTSNTANYPTASTCFNKFTLPLYDSPVVMCNRLVEATQDHMGSFGLV